jgi:hypothetical protein
MSGWAQLLSNAATMHIKRYLYDVLKDRFPRNELFIDRLVAAMQTNADIEGLGKFVVDVFEIGYLKAMKDQEEALKKCGLKATIKAEIPEDFVEKNNIFPNQSSNDG